MFTNTIPSLSSTNLPVSQNIVLRNTYWLLALSMIPTIIGAFIGVTTGIVSSLGVGISTILFLVVAFGFMFAIEKYKESGAGVALLLAFTFFMGLMLSRLLIPILGLSNGASLIMTAFGGTAIIFAAMASLSTFIKRDLSSMGKFLFAGAILILVGSLINIFLQSSIFMLVISVLAIGIFSAFILYDLKRIIEGGETNYITATLGIYLSIYNIFQSLLTILGVVGGDRD